MKHAHVLDVLWGDERAVTVLPLPMVLWVLQYAGIVRFGNKALQVTFYAERPRLRRRRRR